MPTLPVVIAIVDLVDQTAPDQPIDAEAEAERLLRRHPDADATVGEVASIILEEASRTAAPTRQDGELAS